MAYDEDLAERVRGLLAPLAPFEERKMFGGPAFMVTSRTHFGFHFEGCAMVSTATVTASTSARFCSGSISTP